MPNPPAVRSPPLPLIVAITASGTLAVHIYLPALPAVAADLGAAPAAVQMTLTLYLVGLAIGQLFYGSLSDRFGRKPLLVGGLALNLAGSLAAMLAPGIGALLAARVVQAFGACSGQALGRAMLRDAGGDVMKRIAILSTCMAIAPAFSPAIGGWIAGTVGWRGIFAALAATSGVLLLFAVFRLQETNLRRSAATGLPEMFRSFAALLKLPAFRNNAIAGALGSTNIYAYLAAAPFLFATLLHRPPHEVGIYLLMQVASVSIGTFSAVRLGGRLGAKALAAAGCLFQLAGGAILVAIGLLGVLSVAAVVGPMLVFGVGTGLIYPSGMALTLGEADDRRVGAASALFGCLQMGLGAVMTMAVSLWGGASALPTATLLFGSAATATLFFRLGRRA